MNKMYLILFSFLLCSIGFSKTVSTQTTKTTKQIQSAHLDLHASDDLKNELNEETRQKAKIKLKEEISKIQQSGADIEGQNIKCDTKEVKSGPDEVELFSECTVEILYAQNI